jgi:peroxiredoxin/outer membrane lipoprotein-sorting protein
VRVDLTRHRRVREGQDWEPTGNGALIVADGKQIWNLTRHPASNQLRADAQRPETLISALRGIDPLLGFFTPQTASAVRYLGTRIVDGNPLEVVETADTVTGERRQIFIREDGLPVRTITTTTTSNKGNVIREVRLTNLRRNIDLPSDVFVFTPPKDAIPVEKTGSRQTAAKPSGPAIGQIAPDFMVEDASGKPVRLSDYKGKTVLLKFWATWCWSCRQSLPETQKLAKATEKDGVAVLAVALWDSPAAFQKWTAANAAQYPSLKFAFDRSPQGLDTGSALYGVAVTPTEYVIGRDGTVQAVFQGYDGPSSALAEAVKKAAVPESAAASQ